ncbi:unnamed protein product [Phytophthora fragariaefolia]|uniref:Unnamed protein product n=1 Tax=Phytophthora fragariaefolia TaxID=1490495 RepID=A0A9W6Y2J0_9STRA|nr:unnamed protein product [Phytophthora fragariaefolia]
MLSQHSSDLETFPHLVNALSGPEHVDVVKEVSSDRSESIIEHSRLPVLVKDAAVDDGHAADEDEERAIDQATIAKMRAEMEAINLRLNYRDWFQGGKTLEQVRAILRLPAKGDAVGHVNWVAFQNYLKYVQEMEVKAANAAKVAQIKQKLTFKGWFLEGKSFTQVRAILGLPAKGEAVGHPNWQTFLAYLEFVKAYSKQFH